MRAALAEASGYADDDELGMDNLNLASDEDDIFLPDDASDTSTPKLSSRSSLKHVQAANLPSEPLEGSGVVRRSYQESSAPPEGAGGYQTGEFVPPQVNQFLRFYKRHVQELTPTALNADFWLLCELRQNCPCFLTSGS